MQNLNDNNGTVVPFKTPELIDIAMDDDEEWRCVLSRCPMCLEPIKNIRTHMAFCPATTDSDNRSKTEPETTLIATPQNALKQSPSKNDSLEVKAEQDWKMETDDFAYQTMVSTTCRFCFEIVPGKQMTGHIRFHCQMKRYPCGRCKKRFRNFSTHASHVSAEECVPLPFECPMCLRRFQNTVKLNLHAGKFSCVNKKGLADDSKEQFRNKKELEEHETYSCIAVKNSCGVEKMPSETTLDTISNPSGIFPCPCCRFYFQDVAEFQVHVTRYCMSLPHPCSSCSQRFMGTDLLEFHQKSCSRIASVDESIIEK